MSQTTLLVTTTLAAVPDEIFLALTDEAVHSAFTDSRSQIDATSGGAFSYFDGAIAGTFVELDSPHVIRQRLRAADWPEGDEAEVRTELIPTQDGAATLVRVLETGAPEDALDEIAQGWSDYWAGLAAYLVERKKQVVHEFVEKFKNQHDSDCVDAYLTEDCRIHVPLPGLPEGREGMRVNGRMINGAFSDVHVKRDFFVAEGDIVVERARAQATHLGELMGVEPTESPVTWTELHAYRVEGGKITEIWSEADFMGIMVQIGAVAMPGDRDT